MKHRNALVPLAVMGSLSAAISAAENMLPSRGGYSFQFGWATAPMIAAEYTPTFAPDAGRPVPSIPVQSVVTP
jgi:hypothetical protein